jgi:hypothetical protein
MRLPTRWQPHGCNDDAPGMEQAAGFGAVELRRRHLLLLREIVDCIYKGARPPPEAGRVCVDLSCAWNWSVEVQSRTERTQSEGLTEGYPS